MKKSFSLLGVDPKIKVDVWRTALTETFVPVELANYEPVDFSVSIETALFGALEVSHLAGVGQDINRPRQMIRSGDDDPFIAVIQLGGLMSYEHSGESATEILQGVTLFDVTREYRTLHRDRLDIIDVTIPRKYIESLFGSTRNLAGLSIGVDQPMTGLITEFFRKQMQIADKLTPEAAIRLGAIGADLLAAAFLEKLGRTPGRGTASTTAMVNAKNFIRARLGDDALTPELVAASQNLSLRRMQEIFAGESLSISDYIWDQRILRAREMLESNAFARLPVSEIAYAVGFVSLPHFSRRFRSRFGCSPNEARQLKTQS